MNGEEFNKLDGKLNKIHADVIETKVDVVDIKGKVAGHADRIEVCEKDRDNLFSSRNNHETRLTKIETYRKAEAKFDGTERRNKTVTFDWIMRIVMALFAAGTCVFLAIKTFGDDSQIHCENYCCKKLVKTVGELLLPDTDTWSGEYRILLHSTTCKKATEEAKRHNKVLKFFMSDNPETIKRMMPGDVSADVVVCRDCKLTRQVDGKVCKAICCVYYRWIVEKPLKAHKQNCRLLKLRELEKLKLVCLACCPNKEMLVSMGFDLCPVCFELKSDSPGRRKYRRESLSDVEARLTMR